MREDSTCEKNKFRIKLIFSRCMREDSNQEMFYSYRNMYTGYTISNSANQQNAYHILLQP